MRIVSYNVRYFGHALKGLASTRRSKIGIAKAMSSLHPLADVICLQEVETISIRSRIAFRGRPKAETQLESFMSAFEQVFAERRREFPYDAYYFRAHSYGSVRMPIYTTGLAILINRERIKVASNNCAAPAHITHHHVERFRDRKQTRICAHMKVKTPSGRVLHLFNTHLSLPTPFAVRFWTSREKMGFGSNQLREAHALSHFITQISGYDPFLVCGDFNSPPGSPVYRYLTGMGLSGAQESLGLIDCEAPRGFPTAGLGRLRMHLDHLFAGRGIEWRDMGGTQEFGDRSSPFHGLSDHCPLIANFALR